MSPSPAPSRPWNSVLSNPCAASAVVRRVAWIDGPPIFNRVITRATRAGGGFEDIET